MYLLARSTPGPASIQPRCTRRRLKNCMSKLCQINRIKSSFDHKTLLLIISALVISSTCTVRRCGQHERQKYYETPGYSKLYVKKYTKTDPFGKQLHVNLGFNLLLIEVLHVYAIIRKLFLTVVRNIVVYSHRHNSFSTVFLNYAGDKFSWEAAKMLGYMANL